MLKMTLLCPSVGLGLLSVLNIATDILGIALPGSDSKEKTTKPSEAGNIADLIKKLDDTDALAHLGDITNMAPDAFGSEVNKSADQKVNK